MIEIKTDERHIGIGNAGLCPNVTKKIIDSKLILILIGENPLNADYLFEEVYRSNVAYDQRGAIIAVISALGTALLDIRGQAPLISPYSGCWEDEPSRSSIRITAACTRGLNSLQAEAARYKAEEFTSMKLRCGYPLTEGLVGLKKNVEMVLGRAGNGRRRRDLNGEKREKASSIFLSTKSLRMTLTSI